MPIDSAVTKYLRTDKVSEPMFSATQTFTPVAATNRMSFQEDILYNNGGVWGEESSALSNRFVAPSSGYYYFFLNLSAYSPPTGYMSHKWRKNGVDMAYETYPSNLRIPHGKIVSSSCILNLNKDDIIAIWITEGSASGGSTFTSFKLG
jgi:hypothetical protein